MKWFVVLGFLLASVAYGGEIKLRSASGDGVGGCVRATDNPSVPETMMQCGIATGMSFTLHTLYPSDAAMPDIGYLWNMSSSDTTPSGNACTSVCMGVIKSGQKRQNLNLTACNPIMAIVPQQPQYQITKVTPAFALTPKDTTGTPCDITSCADAELYVVVSVIGDEAFCSGHTLSSRNYHGFKLTYQ